MATITTESRYRYVITTLVGLLCLIAGFALSSERSVRQVAVNTSKITALERQYERIDAKLDLLLAADHGGD